MKNNLLIEYFIKFLGCVLLSLGAEILDSKFVMAHDQLLCSEGPSLHLNENFPTDVVVLAGLDWYEPASRVKMITSVLSQNDSPQIIMFGLSDKEMKDIFNSLPVPIQHKWSQFVSLFSTDIVWAQDFFEAFNDKNGRPFIRQVSGYKKGKYEIAADDLKSKLNPLGISAKEPINASGAPAKGGHAGGNIESTNEGFCLIGNADLTDQEWSEIANQNCGGVENTIKLPTDWLPAYHVDELIKPLPNNSDPVCEAQFGIVSSQKAIELLEMRPDDLFFDSGSSSLNLDMFNSETLRSVCATVLSRINPKEIEPWKKELKPIDNYEPVFPPQGYIKYGLPINPDGFLGLYQKCLSIKNKDIVSLFKEDPWFRGSLEFVQDKLEESKQIITHFYKQKRPDCEVSFVDIPELFLVEKEKYFSNDRSRSFLNISSQAILPNAINSLKVGKNIFVPNTGNQSFNDYITHAYQNANLTPVFLDIFLLHRWGGDIHCASHTIHSCQPRATK